MSELGIEPVSEKVLKRAVSKRNKITKEVFKEAIIGSYGNLSEIARRLGLKSRNPLYNFLEKNPRMKDLLEKQKEIVLDDAELELHKMAFSSITDPQIRFKAVKFILESKGGSRGYNPKIIQFNQQNNVFYNNIKEDVLNTENKIRKILEK